MGVDARPETEAPAAGGGASTRIGAVLVAGRRLVDEHYLVVVGIASLALYVATWPVNRVEAEDGFVYAQYAEDGAEGLNPRHLLYQPLVRGTYLVVHAVVPAVRAHGVMTVISLISSVLTMCLVAWVLREMLGRALAVTLAATATLGVSYGFWRYATEADAYALANLLAVAVFVLAFRWTDGKGLTAAAILGALTVLVHIGTALGVLAAIPLGLVRRVGFRRAVQYGVTVTAIIVVTGAIAMVVTGSTLDALEETAPYSGPLTFVAGAAGIAVTVVSGNFIFAYERVSEQLNTALSASSFVEEVYLGRHAGAFVRVGSLLTVLLVVGVVLYGLIAWFRYRDRADAVPRDIATTIVVWLIGLTVIGVAGSGGNPEGWLFILPPAALALALWPLPALRRGAPALLVLLPVALLLHNFVGGMAMLQSPEGDYNRASSVWLLEHAGPEDVVVLAGDYDFTGYVQYHSDATVYAANEFTAAELEAFAREADGDVYVTAEVVEPTPFTFALGPDSQAEMAQFADDVADDLEVVHRSETGGPVYLLR